MEASDEEFDIQNSGTRLGHEWVQVLINLRMKYARSFTGKRHSATTAWNAILQEMQDLGAPKSITRSKIKKKWMNLIARYKQLKSDADVAKQNLWPYFEQINRAYSRNRSNEGDGSKEELVQDDVNYLFNDTAKYSEKEKFMRTLIDMRYKYRHLFTGKKYAAQNGWMVIQNYLPSGTKYSIDQIRKVWQNLVQRYKTLVDNEPDHHKISWIYFEQLHKIMALNSNGSGDVNVIEFVDQNDSALSNSGEIVLPDENKNPFEGIAAEKPEVVPFLCESIDVVEGGNDEQIVNEIKTEEADNVIIENGVQKRKSTTSLDDLLNYLKERDEKRDEQMRQMLTVMQDILHHLKQ